MSNGEPAVKAPAAQAVKGSRNEISLIEYDVPGAFLKLPLRVMTLRTCNGIRIDLVDKLVFAKLVWNFRRSRELPNSTHSLADDFGVSRNRIQRALDALVAAHLICRVARKRNGLHHVNGYALVPHDLITDDADLYRLTDDARVRRDAWKAECEAIDAIETSLKHQEAKRRAARLAKKNADIAAREAAVAIREADIAAREAAIVDPASFAEYSEPAMVQNGSSRWSEMDQPDAPKWPTGNGSTHRPSETRRIDNGETLADDFAINTGERSEKQKVREIFSALACGHALPWYDDDGQTKCMACSPPSDVHLIPNTASGVSAFSRAVRPDLDAATRAARELDEEERRQWEMDVT